MKEQPLYDHDCTSCVFLGTYNGYADLYWCMQGTKNRPTLIARFSDDPPDYLSGIPFRKVYPELAKAYVLAQARGLLLPSDGAAIVHVEGKPFENN